MARLEWEKASRRDRQRLEKLRTHSRRIRARGRLKDDERQRALSAFADKHELTCFAAGPHSDQWAKSGWNKRGPWIICVSGVARNRRTKGLPAERRQG
jgi:hypothetical protein